MRFLRDRHTKFFAEAEWLVHELTAALRPCQAEALHMACMRCCATVTWYSSVTASQSISLQTILVCFCALGDCVRS